MRSRAAEYLLNAANCLTVAEQVSDPATRADLMKMAQAWFALAKQAERNSQTDLVYETPAQEQQVAQQQQQVQPKDEPKDD